jgi:hypothetical protein
MIAQAKVGLLCEQVHISAIFRSAVLVGRDEQGHWGGLLIRGTWHILNTRVMIWAAVVSECPL